MSEFDLRDTDDGLPGGQIALPSPRGMMICLLAKQKRMNFQKYQVMLASVSFQRGVT